MEFDVGSKFIFMGDTSGSVYVMRLVGNAVQLVSKMSAHTGWFIKFKEKHLRCNNQFGMGL